jgi:sec-independent protein translocase protein TatA
MGVHLPELIVIFVVALLVFGPKRLPEMGAQIGKSINAFKKGMSELTDTTSTALSTSEASEISRLEARRLELDILEREIALKKAQAELGESHEFVSSSYDTGTTVEADYAHAETTFSTADHDNMERTVEGDYTNYREDYASPTYTYSEETPVTESTESTVPAPAVVEHHVELPTAQAELVPQAAHSASGTSTQAE